MSIKKRGDVWHIDIVAPGGKRIRRSTSTTDKKQALEYHDRLKSELWEMSRLNKKPERFLEDAVILFLRDGQDQKSFKTKQSRAEYLLKYFSGRELSSITGEEIRESLPVKVERTGKPDSNATLNRYRADIMLMFSLAHKSSWIVAVPYVPRSKKPNVRVRWITREKAVLLIQNLSLDLMKMCVLLRNQQVHV